MTAPVIFAVAINAVGIAWFAFVVVNGFAAGWFWLAVLMLATHALLLGVGAAWLLRGGR